MGSTLDAKLAFKGYFVPIYKFIKDPIEIK